MEISGVTGALIEFTALQWIEKPGQRAYKEKGRRLQMQPLEKQLKQEEEEWTESVQVLRLG